MIPLNLPLAEFSPCGKYRFTLWRHGLQDQGELDPSVERVANEHSYVQFIGLNPSTATEYVDDPTIRRCIGFATRQGFSSLLMTNIFAWRDKSPEQMKKDAKDPTGDPVNIDRLVEFARGAGRIVAAWGSHGKYRARAATIREALKPFAEKCFALRVSMASGQPEHPLYLPADVKLIPLPL